MRPENLDDPFSSVIVPVVLYISSCSDKCLNCSLNVQMCCLMCLYIDDNSVEYVIVNDQSRIHPLYRVSLHTGLPICAL